MQSFRTMTPAPFAPPAGPQTARPRARGKFLERDGEKRYVRGVTYGGFAPNAAGEEFPERATVAADFAAMAANGVTTVRTYTCPPVWLLDEARAHGLDVMVGIAWETHVAFLDDARRADAIEGRVREAVRSCAGHAAVLCFAVGNEIPTGIVRWHGPRRVERFIERLARAVRDEDPGALVTYVNYPSTEYLELPFLDLVCFNVFLEDPADLTRYLARLQTLSGDRPLILSEVGLDSRGNGLAEQARSLRWQIAGALRGGCAGVVVFSWTDEWHRGGADVLDWEFGLTTRERQPKPALAAVREAFAAAPTAAGDGPLVSVVLCTHDGARTLRDSCEGLARLAYPHHEVIVVDDGSTDDSAAIAASYGFRVISTSNQGLAAARNVGLEAARGEIVAYIDDDARPDPHWLDYLVQTFREGGYAGVGGPNLVPEDDGLVAQCVARAPGNPRHVLIDDREAEHLPGCNMAFRRDALLAVGGFDPQFRIAGDDVDLCWRLLDRGERLGFCPAAVVWHRRRDSLARFWRQQREYGRSEALLERRWPDRYNRVGHARWAGRLYGGAGGGVPRLRRKIAYGPHGTAAFQSSNRHEPALGIATLSGLPELYLALVGAAVAFGLAWLCGIAVIGAPLLALVAGVLVGGAALGAARAPFPPGTRRRDAVRNRAIVFVLHLMQPLARLVGRMRAGLTPWREHGSWPAALPIPRSRALWSERWRPVGGWVDALAGELRRSGVAVLRGGPSDRWELEARGGGLGGIRIRLAVEEHGDGRQLVRLRAWPRASRSLVAFGALVAVLGVCAWLHGDVPVAALLGALAAVAAAVGLRHCATAAGALRSAVAALAAAPSTQRGLPEVRPAPAAAARALRGTAGVGGPRKRAS